MAGRLKDRLNRGGEGVGFGLEDGAAAALDLVGPLAQSTEEGADRVTDAGFGAEAGVGGHLAVGDSGTYSVTYSL